MCDQSTRPTIIQLDHYYIPQDNLEPISALKIKKKRQTLERQTLEIRMIRL